MFEINGTLLVLLLFLVIGSVCGGWFAPTRVFLEPFDQNTFKKSCGDGMLAGEDYFVLKGLVNISGISYGQRGAIAIWVRVPSHNYLLEETVIQLYYATCRDLDKIPIDTCKCMFMDPKYVRVKCNLTAKIEFSRNRILLHYSWLGVYNSAYLPLPVVYGTPSCTERSVNRAATSNPESLTAIIGPALLGTAVGCLGSSIFSQG